MKHIRRVRLCLCIYSVNIIQYSYYVTRLSLLVCKEVHTFDLNVERLSKVDAGILNTRSCVRKSMLRLPYRNSSNIRFASGRIIFVNCSTTETINRVITARYLRRVT